MNCVVAACRLVYITTTDMVTNSALKKQQGLQKIPDTVLSHILELVCEMMEHLPERR